MSFGNSFGVGSSVKSKGKWYFYNSQSLSFGASEFTKTWGSRPSVDLWRYSDEKQSSTTNLDKEKSSGILRKYDVASYLEKLPKTKEVVDSLKFARNEALFETGIIYKEQFKNRDLAVSRLEKLLTLNPDKNNIIAIKYHLYQLYAEFDTSKATLLLKIRHHIMQKSFRTSK